MNAKEQNWVKIFREHKTSGLSQKVFCEQRYLKLSTFLYWRGRLQSTSVKTENKIVEIIDNDKSLIPVPKPIVGRHLEIRWSKNSGFLFQMGWG